MNELRYLDANATQPLRPSARNAVFAAFEVVGNPSSIHQSGRAVRCIMEDARETIAQTFGAQPQDVVFTSGGTEADAAAVHAVVGRRRLIISAIEHDAVRAAAVEAARLAAVDALEAAGAPAVVPVNSDGVVDLQALDRQLSDGIASLVCLMLANNETGVIQPVQEAAAICRRHNALLHVDAVQAAGRMPVNLNQLGAHSLAISSHKLGGPTGVGALLLAPDAPFAAPLFRGGGQERGRRGGTPAAALIAGFAAAARSSEADDQVYLARLRDIAEQAAIACGAIVCGDPRRRLPNTSCIALPGIPASTQVIALDLEKIAVSAGSACSSGKVQTSHVLHAMGLGALAGQAIRVSLPWNATRTDVDAFSSTYRRVAAQLRLTLAPRTLAPRTLAPRTLAPQPP